MSEQPELNRRRTDQFHLAELRLVNTKAQALMPVEEDRALSDEPQASNDNDVSLQVGFGKPEQNGAQLAFQLRFKIVLPPGNEPGAEVLADYRVVMIQEQEHPLPQDDLVALGTTLLPEAVYPYFRALVTRLTSEMGLAATTLGFLKTSGGPPQVIIRDQ